MTITNVRIVLLILLISIFLSACDKNSGLQRIDFQGPTMGTQYHVSIVSQANQAIAKEKIQTAIDESLKNINQQLSTYISDSEISRFNQSNSTNWKSVSTEFYQVVKAAQQISEETRGAFDITVSPLVDLWGFGHKTQFKTPDRVQLNSIKTSIGYQNLLLKGHPPTFSKKIPDLQIDLSAIAKGYAVDRISNLLTDLGYQDHLVEIGGELYASGTNQIGKPWKVAVETPQQMVSQSIALNLQNKGVATSGDYRNFYVENGKRYAHIIDPRTGYPTRNSLASVTVIHDSVMKADAYATALMVMGEDKAKSFIQQKNLEAILFTRDDKNHFTMWNSLDAKNK